MSLAIAPSTAVAAPWGENVTAASSPGSPKDVQFASGGRAAAKPAASSRCDTYPLNAETNASTTALPRIITALLHCTKIPRQLKFVDPQTTVGFVGLSTMIDLLC